MQRCCGSLRHLLWHMLVCLPLVDCVADRQPVVVHMPIGQMLGKPQAPVDITSTVDDKGAHVAVLFGQAAQQVSIEIRGVGPIQLESVQPLSLNKTFAKGDIVKLWVPYTLKPQDKFSGDIVISVTGQFAGAIRCKVASVSVGGSVWLQQLKLPIVNKSPAQESYVILPSQRR